jgi:uncharacterized protein YbjT (DUF2867 family)
MSLEVLVIGGRGRVGREVLRALAPTGARVRALVRTAGSLRGAREVVGDLGDPVSLRAALDGVGRVFFVTPHDPAEERLGRNLIEAALDAGVKRIVFASAFHADITSGLGMRLFVGAMSLLTHYGPKLSVERHVRLAKAASPVVLMPSNFYQNDELFLPEIHAGVYPQPLGVKGVNRVDCRDIGDAAARALTDDAIESGGYPLVGPDAALTGPACAEVWGKALGREVVYDGDLDRWYALMAERMHARERGDFKKTYKIFARMRVAAKPAEIERCTRLLGRPPHTYESYVAATVAAGVPAGSPERRGSPG